MSDAWFVQYCEEREYAPEVVHEVAFASYEKAKAFYEEIMGNPAFWDVSIVAPNRKEAIRAQKMDELGVGCTE